MSRKKAERIVTRRPGQQLIVEPATATEGKTLSEDPLAAAQRSARSLSEAWEVVEAAQKRRMDKQNAYAEEVKEIITKMVTEALPYRPGDCFESGGVSVKYNPLVIVYAPKTRTYESARTTVACHVPLPSQIYWSGSWGNEKVEEGLALAREGISQPDRVRLWTERNKKIDYPAGWHRPNLAGIKKRLANQKSIDGNYNVSAVSTSNLRDDGAETALCRRIWLVADLADLRQVTRQANQAFAIEEYLTKVNLLEGVQRKEIGSQMRITFDLKMIPPKKKKEAA